MKKFLKESFSNGNRFTNIMISIITGLLLIIAFFLKDIYSDYKDTRKDVQQLKESVVQIKTFLKLNQ